MKTIASAFVKAKRAFGPALKDKPNPVWGSAPVDRSLETVAIDGEWGIKPGE